MTIIEKINSLPKGHPIGVINSLDEGSDRTSTWAGSTGITTDEVKSVALALDKAETRLKDAVIIIAELAEQQAMSDDNWKVHVAEMNEALATIKALKEKE